MPNEEEGRRRRDKWWPLGNKRRRHENEGEQQQQKGEGEEKRESDFKFLIEGHFCHFT